MDVRNPDPDTIILLQGIAMLADTQQSEVIVRPEGLLLRRSVGTREMKELISWAEMRNIVGGPLWVIESRLGYMVREMGK